MNFPNLKLTDYGSAAIMAAAYGQGDLIFTSVRLGSGTHAMDDSVKNMSNIMAQKATVGITTITVENKVATITFELALAELTTASFYLRELGIMCAQTEGGTERLYAYTNAGDDAILVKKDTSGNHVTIKFTVHVTVGDAETVQAVISGVTGYVTEQTFYQHVNDRTNPHNVTKEQIGLGNVENVAPDNMRITFSKPTNIAALTNGDELRYLMGRTAKAVDVLIAHLRANNNPHGVTPKQIGAAAAEHAHSTNDITSGTLPLEHGGTGMTNLDDLKSLVANNPIYVEDTLLHTRWSGNQYSFDGAYPPEKWNIDVSIAPGASIPQQEAFGAAMLAGSASSNVLTALGDVPVISIPIIIKLTEVL